MFDEHGNEQDVGVNGFRPTLSNMGGVGRTIESVMKHGRYKNVQVFAKNVLRVNTIANLL